MSKIKLFFNKVWSIINTTLRYLNEDEPIVYSAAIAFFSIFSLPAILVVVSMVGSLFIAEEAVQNEIVAQAGRLINREAASQIKSVLHKVTDLPSGTWAIVLSILLVVKSATIILFIVQKALNSIWRVKLKDKVNHFRVIGYRLLTFLMIAGLGLALIVNVMVDAVLVICSEELKEVFAEYMSPVVWAIQRAVGVLIALTVFSTMLKALPDARISWRDTLVGGVITTIFFLIGIQLIELILGKIKVAGIYSAAGSLVVVLLWIFYSSLIFFLGAEVTKAYATHHGRHVEPSSIAVKYKKVTYEEEV